MPPWGDRLCVKCQLRLQRPVGAHCPLVEHSCLGFQMSSSVIEVCCSRLCSADANTRCVLVFTTDNLFKFLGDHLRAHKFMVLCRGSPCMAITISVTQRAGPAIVMGSEGTNATGLGIVIINECLPTGREVGRCAPVWGV